MAANKPPGIFYGYIIVLVAFCILGVGGGIWVIFGVTSPIIAGYIFDIMSNYQLAFLICAAISIVGSVLSLQLKPIGEKGGTNDPRRSIRLN